MPTCHLKQDEFVDHKVGSSPIAIEIPSSSLSSPTVIPTPSEVPTFGGVLTELNNVQKHRSPLSPSSNGAVRQAQHRLPPPPPPGASVTRKGPKVSNRF